MGDLVWILDSEKSSSFGSEGIAGKYILPKNEINLEPKILIASRIWIVLRGHEDRLFMLLKLKKIERVISGYYAGDYLLSPEISESIRLVLNFASADKYHTSSLQTFSTGVSELSANVSIKFVSLIKEAIQTKLLPPDMRLIKKINLPFFSNDNYRLAIIVIRAIISSLTLEQIWGSGNGNRLGPISNFAYAVIHEKTGIKPDGDLIEVLRALDPISIILNGKMQTPESETLFNSAKPPSVDTTFTAIDPNNICAREFVFSNLKFRDFEEELKKTEHAEKVHQIMLKDISEFLLKVNITPYESNSIDLLYNSNNKLYVFELKSANALNIISQASKGAFQLACYFNELSKDYNNIDTRLVLHETDSPEIQNYAFKALQTLGVKVLVYDPGKAWPNRVQGLP